jgi:acyl dehydratase
VRHWEDFQVGEVEQIGTRKVARDEVIAFAREYDPQPFHVDEGAAAKSMYGGLVMRMMCDAYLLDSASVGSPGIDNLKWLKPVRPGDTIRAQRTTLESRASKSRPDIGIVKNRWEVFNQEGEMVMSMEGYGMFRRRDAGAQST